jgi:integrase
MTSFRSPKAQAAHAVGQRLAIGKSRYDRREDGLVHSLGTARNYASALSGFTRFLNEHRLGCLATATVTDAMSYLAVRSAEVRQSAMDLDRQALQAHLGVHLERVRSDLATERGGRALRPEQYAAIRERLTPRNALAVELCERCGLRAHELATLRPAAEQPRSSHRTWRSDLHVGRDGELFSVRGKGGLVRHAFVPREIAEKLQAVRLHQTHSHEAPRTVRDRQINYEIFYDVGFGQALSQAYSRASVAALGFSFGLHSTRHSFCQLELERLQSGIGLPGGSGYSREDALEIVSQLVGHFRPDVVNVYLR